MIALMNDLGDESRGAQDLLLVLESLLGCAVLLSWFAANRYVGSVIPASLAAVVSLIH